MFSTLKTIKTTFNKTKEKVLAEFEARTEQTLAGEFIFGSYYYVLRDTQELNSLALDNLQEKVIYKHQSQGTDYSIVKINQKEGKLLDFCNTVGLAVLPPQNEQDVPAYSVEYLQTLESFLNSDLYKLIQVHNRILKPTAGAEEGLGIEHSITKEELEKGYAYVRKYAQNLVHFLDIKLSSDIAIIISEITADSKVKLTFRQTFEDFKKEELKQMEADLKLKLNFLFSDNIELGDNIELAAELLTSSWKEKTSISTVLYHFTINDFNKFSAYLKNFQEFGEQLHSQEGITLASKYFLKIPNIPIKLEVINGKCYCTLTWPAGIDIKKSIHIYGNSLPEEQKLFTLYGNKLVFSSLEKLSLFTKEVEILEENNNYQRKINEIENYLGVRNASIKIVSSLQYIYILSAEGLGEALKVLEKELGFSQLPSANINRAEAINDSANNSTENTLNNHVNFHNGHFGVELTEAEVSDQESQSLAKDIEDLEGIIVELKQHSSADFKYFSTFEELSSFLLNITETQAANINKEEIKQFLCNLRTSSEDFSGDLLHNKHNNSNNSSGPNNTDDNRECDSSNESAEESDTEPENKPKGLLDLSKLTRLVEPVELAEDIEINYIKTDLEASIEWQVKLPRVIKGDQELKANLQIINQQIINQGWLRNKEIILEEGEASQRQFLSFKGFPLNWLLFMQELSLLRKYSLTFTKGFKQAEVILLEFLQSHNGAALGPVINVKKIGSSIYINFSEPLRANIWFQILSLNMQCWPSSGTMEIELFLEASTSLSIFCQEEFKPIIMRKKELLEAGLTSRLVIKQEKPYLIITTDLNIRSDFQRKCAKYLSQSQYYRGKIEIFLDTIPDVSGSFKEKSMVLEINFTFSFLKKKENIIIFYQEFLNSLRNIDSCVFNLSEIITKKIPLPDMGYSFSKEGNWFLCHISKPQQAERSFAEVASIVLFPIETPEYTEEKEQIYIKDERTLAIKLDSLREENSAIPRALEKIVGCKLPEKLTSGALIASANQEELSANPLIKQTFLNYYFLNYHYLIDFMAGLISGIAGATAAVVLTLKFAYRLQKPINFELFSKAFSFPSAPIIITSVGVGTFLIGAIITELCYECLKDKLENVPENKENKACIN